MIIKENKYHSTIKVEFRDSVWNMVHSERSLFQVYTIHRLLNLGLIIGFTFDYCANSTPDEYIYIELDLKEHGKVQFRVSTKTNYGSIADEASFHTLEKFLEEFDTGLDEKGKKGILGL